MKRRRFERALARRDPHRRGHRLGRRGVGADPGDRRVSRGLRTGQLQRGRVAGLGRRLHAASPTDSVPSSASSSAGGPTTDAGASGAATPTDRPPLPLAGSGIRVPAAWTGRAEVTITVLGECAAVGRDVVLCARGRPRGAAPGRRQRCRSPDPNPISLTLGVTPGGIPGCRGELRGRRLGRRRATHLVARDRRGDRPARRRSPACSSRTSRSTAQLPPNLLTDNETDLLPCESGGTVGVPRTLAAGSTLTGWVSETAAELELHGVTTDGERQSTPGSPRPACRDVS